MIKRFFEKIRTKSLIFKLHKLSTSAFILNDRIQKSKMPDDIKLVSNQLLDTYAGLLILTNNKF